MTSGTRVRQTVGSVLLGLGLAQGALIAGSAMQVEATPPTSETHGHMARECEGALAIGELPDGAGEISLQLDEATDGTGSLEVRINFGSPAIEPADMNAEDATPPSVEEIEKAEVENGGVSADGAVAATPSTQDDETECVSIFDGELSGSWVDELPIGIDEAITIARDHADGDLESLVLEHDDDASTYTITIGGEEIVIDALTGEVIAADE